MSERVNIVNMARADEIVTICAFLERYWLANPSLRLGQIIGNFTPGQYMGDPYMVPDSFWTETLK